MSDLIDRQAVINAIANTIVNGESLGYGLAEEIVSEITSVENKGEWIHPYRSDIACECSACHMQMPITDYFHYCPNCGADMRGEE